MTDLERLAELDKAERENAPGAPHYLLLAEALVNYWRSGGRELAEDGERYRWLRDRTTYCNTHPGGRPVLYDDAKRLWYHATDDLKTETLDSAIDTAMSEDAK